MTDLPTADAPQPCRFLVSIINYRTAQMTQDCVRSVLHDFDVSGLSADEARIVVIDNASGDGSDRLLTDWIAAEGLAPRVRLILSPANSGFSGGHNQGLAAGPADFYLVLNSDALLRPGFCRTMLEAAAADPRAGLFAPLLEYDDGTPQVSLFRLPDPANEIIRGAQTRQVTRLLARHDMPLPSPPEHEAIGWASFACILLRGSMVDQIGPMDEGYFLYFEDTEYCLRAGRAGWTIRHVPQARAVHFRGGSAPVKSLAAARKRLPAYYYASRTRFFYQAHGRLGLLAANLGWSLGRGLAYARAIGGRNIHRGTTGEARDLWINFLDPLGDRRAPAQAAPGGTTPAEAAT